MPTRLRSSFFLKTLNLYYKYLPEEISYQFLISCDKDNDTKNNHSMRKKLKESPSLQVIYTNNKSKVKLPRLKSRGFAAIGLY